MLPRGIRRNEHVQVQVDGRVDLGRVYPLLTLASGVAVVAVGARLLIRRLHVLRRSGQSHPHRHVHTLPAGVPPLSWRGLALLATSGGAVPSPSAVIVLVSAFVFGRLALGLGLMLAFSVGLAATLSAVGLALVLGGRALETHATGRAAALLPVAGAGALPLLGLVLVIQGLRAL